MWNRLWVLLALLLSVSSPLFAEYTLNLDYSVQFPLGAGWDIRCVMNDSTYASVWALGDTIYWNTEPGGVVSRFRVPIDFQGPTGWLNGPAIRWIRLSSRPDQMCVAWNRCSRSIYGGPDMDSWYDTFYIVIIDVSTGEILVQRLIAGGGYDDILPRYESWAYLTPMQTQPALPAFSESIFLSCILTETDHLPVQSARESSSAFRFRLEPSYAFTYLREARNLSFYPLSAMRYAFGGCIYEIYQDEPENPPLITNLTWIGREDFVSGSVLIDSTHGGYALAQQDVSGTSRLITDQGWALDYETLAPLWHNPAINAQNAFVVQATAGANEQLFVRSDSGRFAVYNAGNGSFIDRTTATLGNPQYVMESPNGDAIVTYSHTDATARFYRVQSLPSYGLTCYPQASDPNRIVLRWPPVGTASAYRIYSGSDPTTLPFLEALLPASASACTLTISDPARFYQLVPEMPLP